uniref:Uncharacterized protein n=2 Tax=Cacopsylla melanoneura TaxID=428564 RepID=A0A8D9E4B4_9HEMI
MVITSSFRLQKPEPSSLLLATQFISAFVPRRTLSSRCRVFKIYQSSSLFYFSLFVAMFSLLCVSFQSSTEEKNKLKENSLPKYLFKTLSLFLSAFSNSRSLFPSLFPC